MVHRREVKTLKKVQDQPPFASPMSPCTSSDSAYASFTLGGCMTVEEMKYYEVLGKDVL